MCYYFSVIMLYKVYLDGNEHIKEQSMGELKKNKKQREIYLLFLNKHRFPTCEVGSRQVEPCECRDKK